MASATNHLRFYPTGPGDARDIDISPVHVLEWHGSWNSDGSAMAFTGAENGRQPRVYVLDVAAGKVRPITRGRRDRSILRAGRPVVDRAERTARVRTLFAGRWRAAGGERA